MTEITREEFNDAFASLRADLGAFRTEQLQNNAKLDQKIDTLGSQVADYSRRTAIMETEVRAVDRDLQQAKVICVARHDAALKKQERNWSWLMGLFGSGIMLLIGWVIQLMGKK